MLCRVSVVIVGVPGVIFIPRVVPWVLSASKWAKAHQPHKRPNG